LSANGVDVDLSAGTASGGDAAGDVLSTIENLTGTAMNDTLSGNASANVFLGGALDDIMWGAGGNDTIEGGSGNDTIGGGSGADSLMGGTGTDTVMYVGSITAVTVNLLLGTNSGGYASGDFLSGFENISGSDHDDALTGDGGANTLFGDIGDDTLIGGSGADNLNGGGGFDTADYSSSSLAVTVSLTGTAGIGGDAAGDVLVAIENLVGTALADVLTGNSSNNSLTGGAGNDTLAGRAGADTLTGGDGLDTADYSDSATYVDVSLTTGGNAGDATGDVLSGIEHLLGSAYDDFLFGDGNANRLTGGAGADSLYGGLGNDTLVGGAGADHFVFNTTLDSTNNVDRINDFTTAVDTIALSSTVMTLLGSVGTLIDDAFFSSAGASGGRDLTDRVVYNTTNGALFYDADGSGSGVAIQFALVTIGTTLVASDIIVL
jgi:Ca2+-binding RTX toxin-like protein